MKSLIISLFLIFSCGVLNDPSENSTEPECTETVDCALVCGGSSVEDACGECGGNESTCSGSSMIINYNNTSIPIGGFQFEVEGVNVIDVSGGAAGTAGFMLTTANNIIIGFSLSGSAIPMGEGILVVLDVTGSGDACIVEESLIISDAIGVALSAGTENCNTIHIP